MKNDTRITLAFKKHDVKIERVLNITFICLFLKNAHLYFYWAEGGKITGVPRRGAKGGTYHENKPLTHEKPQ